MDTYDFLADPRALSLQDRRATAARHQPEQQLWQQRLQPLLDGPPLELDFPAYLLATPAFADLARRIGNASARRDLATEVRDELDWFVRAFADYLRTVAGEDVFAELDERLPA